MVERIECVVVGAGIIGLAVARRLAVAGREVLVLEAADAVGTETSSRNSEVVHAGIYYAEGSLKARLCVAGRTALYRFCAERGIDHARLGKLIVAASEDETAALGDLAARGRTNGVTDLELIDGAAARAMEPELVCVAALVSPSTGIVDSHALMLAYQGEAEAHGAVIALRSRFVAGRTAGRGFHIEVADGDGGVMHLACDMLVNAAGLGAQSVASALDGLPPERVPRLYLNKGCYFALTGRSPFKRLVYPVPRAAGLGVHATLDLAGRTRFGPDQEWVDRIDYAVDPARADGFYAAIRRYYPGLADGALEPDYAGIRPKLQAPGAPPADFVIDGPEGHGVPGLVNLFGIESPGLTASLAIADHVAALLGDGRS